MTQRLNLKANKSAVVTVLVMILVITFISSYFLLRNKSSLQKRNNTPAAQALLIEDKNASFTDLAGNKVSTDKQFGKVMVVMSWASWCPQCTNDLQELGKIAQEYKDKKVVVMAINRGEDKYSAERFLATMNIPSELTMMLDPSDYYFKHSDGYAMPETIIFDPKGTIMLHEHGELRPQEVHEALDNVLSK
jgi:thiol-disulfide isomerase/thioredoxin